MHNTTGRDANGVKTVQMAIQGQRTKCINLSHNLIFQSDLLIFITRYIPITLSHHSIKSTDGASKNQENSLCFMATGSHSSGEHKRLYLFSLVLNWKNPQAGFSIAAMLTPMADIYNSTCDTLVLDFTPHTDNTECFEKCPER